MKHSLIKRILFLYFLANSIVSYSQDTLIFKGEARIFTDNDVFVPWNNLDQYYSFGVGAGYAFNSEKFLGLEKLFTEKETYFFDFEIRQEAYTPSNKSISEEDVNDGGINFDRPFAGLLFGTFKSVYIFERSFLKAGILLGIMGPATGAGKAQKWFHENIIDESGLDGWDYQLPNQLLLNISAEYTYDFQINPTWLDIYGTAEGQLGNLFINTSSFLGIRLGKLKDLKRSPSLGNGLLSNQNSIEYFIQSSIGLTLEAFNATAQGNLFNQNHPYALNEINSFYPSMTHGIYLSYKQFSASFNYVFTYGKVLKNVNHIYGSIEVNYRF